MSFCCARLSCVAETALFACACARMLNRIQKKNMEKRVFIGRGLKA